jgi:hypothetical protein
VIDDDKTTQNECSASLTLKDFAKAASMDEAAIAAAVAAVADMAPVTEKADFIRKMIEPALERLKARLDARDKRALLEALDVCFAVDIPVPSWLREAFSGAYHSVPKTWDDPFGRPVPKGKGTGKTRRFKEIRYKLYVSIEERHAQGKAKDNELFRAVGNDFNISRPTAERYYRRFCKDFEGKDFQHPFLQRIVRRLVSEQTAPIVDPSPSAKSRKKRRRSKA